MRLNFLHPWDLSEEQARALQRDLARWVSCTPSLPPQVRFVAGVDISAEDREGVAQGAVVVLRYPEMEMVEVQVARARPSFHYIPGLLAFREVPVLAQALERLSTTPDLLIVDGQGQAHPRRFGIACHLGLLTDLPTIGCAKSRLCGYAGPLGPQAGAWTELRDDGEVIGAALRTKEGNAPLYISIGHKVDLPTALHWVLACCRGHRLPEPTRLAHLAAGGHLPPPSPSAPLQGRLF